MVGWLFFFGSKINTHYSLIGIQYPFYMKYLCNPGGSEHNCNLSSPLNQQGQLCPGIPLGPFGTICGGWRSASCWLLLSSLFQLQSRGWLPPADIYECITLAQTSADTQTFTIPHPSLCWAVPDPHPPKPSPLLQVWMGCEKCTSQATACENFTNSIPNSFQYF